MKQRRRYEVVGAAGVPVEDLDLEGSVNAADLAHIDL